MLTLALASTVIRLAGVWVVADRPVWRALVRLAEPTAFLAAIGGLLALLSSILTGLTYTWPVEVLLTSSVVLNKIAVTVFSTTFWTLFIVTRLIYGPRLWEQARLRRVYAALAAGGFLSLMLAGSTGGHLAGKRSMLDGILHYLGINTHLLFTLSRPAMFGLLSSVALFLTLAGVRRLLWRRGLARTVHHTALGMILALGVLPGAPLVPSGAHASPRLAARIVVSVEGEDRVALIDPASLRGRGRTGSRTETD
jgi:hypothetical protein